MIRPSKNDFHTIGGVFVFLLLGIFALFSVFMVVLTAQLYRGTVDQSESTNDRRVLTSYLMNTVHAGDREGCVSVRSEDGTGVLVLSWPAQEDEDAFETLIYCYDGMICELLADADQPFDPSLGEQVCRAQALSPRISGRLLTIGYTDAEGQQGSLSIRLYAAAEEEAAE